MEAVSDIDGALPPLAIFPSESVVTKLAARDWEAFLKSWIWSIEYRLRMPPDQFSAFKFSQSNSGVSFLVSYLRQYTLRTKLIESGSLEARLHHHCYFLVKRLLLTPSVPYDCSSSDLFALLGDGSIAFGSISDWKVTLKATWKRNETQVKTSIEAQKTSMIRTPSSQESTLVKLRQLTALVRSLPEISVVAIAGSDFLETLMDLYNNSTENVQQAVTESVYYCLRSLMIDSQKRTSMLLDIIFELKSSAGNLQKMHPHQSTLLSSLVCTTSFLRHFAADVGGSKRGQNLVEVLTDYKQMNAQLHPINRSRKVRVSKGKGKAKAEDRDETQVHTAAQISQIHDLFPDLPSAYIIKLLSHFHDDVEATVAGLLEPTSLPVDLQAPAADDDIPLKATDGPVDLVPHATMPLLPQRKGVFDGDDFDKLQISSLQLHRGRRDIIDESQTEDAKSRSKAAIMAALAAFDADDDERDDTYDVADVGGAVDNTLDSDEKRDGGHAEKVEEILFRAWVENPGLFARDSKTRLSNARRQLKEDTNMGDEQIEGWSLMLGRDAKLEDRLRQKFSVVRTFRGNQHTLSSTKWQANASPYESQEESGEDNGDGRRVGAAGIRGTRVWNAGRGRGSTSGNPNDHSTQMARKRKEQGRGRGGASHRKDGRAKKIGRGMGPVTQ